MRALVWFRSDLRVRDNTALWNACREVDRGVVGVFMVSAEQWRAHDWGAAKVEFVLRNVRALSEELAKLNVPLVVETAERFSDAAGVLGRLAKEHGCDGLYYNREYELNESRRDEAVGAAMTRAGIAVRSYTDQVLIEPGEIKTGEGRWYTVFTPFKRAYLGAIGERGFEVLGLPRKQAEMVCRPSRVPVSVAGFGETAVPASAWPEGEAGALRRLRAFAQERIGVYKEKRNEPGIDGTSGISPYLSAGVVSPRQCLRAAIDAGGGNLAALKEGAATWVSELVWREFYKHIVVGFPRVCMGRAFKPETERIPWRDDPAGLAAWKKGRTGVPIVDAGMRQLLQLGWMHNRVRMVTAMYLTKDLMIDWREGERHFMRHLVDGDLAANNGGWQWSASTGTDAAPYFRVFNPASQSRTCDPTGVYIRRYVPELAALDDDEIHAPWEMAPLARQRVAYPEPIVEHGMARERVIAAFQMLKGAR